LPPAGFAVGSSSPSERNATAPTRASTKPATISRDGGAAFADKGEDAVAGIRERPPTSGRSPAHDERTSTILERAETAVREPFVGVHAEGAIPAGLFPLAASGQATGELVDRAKEFLDALTPEQRSRASFAVDDDSWRRWSNIHRFLMRHGLLLDGCTAAERERGLALLAAALSADGFATARNVMRLNETLQELTGRPDEFGEWLYWLSVFGAPSTTEPWGFQIDGHHLIVNCFALGDQLVMTPLFLGSEPVVADSGRYAGTRVLEGEERDGAALMDSLSVDEKKLAVVADEVPRELFTAAFRDNTELDYVGASFTQLAPPAQDLLVALIHRYVDRIRAPHAEVKMAEVRAHLDETHFAWMGGTGPNDAFYYRVQSPVLLIEFDHQGGVVFDNDEPTRRHIHTVVRTPNGNDYGQDLLRQHHERHDHTPGSAHR
jgi:Protein of unknown function (DUF3500)